MNDYAGMRAKKRAEETKVSQVLSHSAALLLVSFGLSISDRVEAQSTTGASAPQANGSMADAKSSGNANSRGFSNLQFTPGTEQSGASLPVATFPSDPSSSADLVAQPKVRSISPWKKLLGNAPQPVAQTAATANTTPATVPTTLVPKSPTVKSTPVVKAPQTSQQNPTADNTAPRAIAQGAGQPSQLAHSPFGGGVPDPSRRLLPTTVGTVKIRKPFKLFAQEQLIHNLSFRDTPVKEVIAEIARRGKLNVLIDKSVVGKITGELRDVTLNEAMDSVIASAGLQTRVLDNSTVIIGSAQSMMQLGLNRSVAKAFKLSYAHPYDVAMLLHASIFNKGVVPDFTKQLHTRSSSESGDKNDSSRQRKAGGSTGEAENTENSNEESSRDLDEQENNQTLRPDQQRIIRGASRSQTQEGTGFNDASTEPGQQRIRSNQEINTDYIVEQNGGGTIVIPDVKNRQVVIVGTPEDLALAEEAIRLLDRRPREVHIQASLVELTNQGIRQLGANLALQGNGLSNSLLGQSNAPLINALPGLAAGVIGNAIPAQSTIAGITNNSVAESTFNYLTLNKAAGGKGNIATAPTALNVTLNLLLQTNKAKIIANPSVVAVDGTEALVDISQEVLHKVTSTVSLGVVTTNVELTKAGIFLNVLPRVSEDGFITMRLRPQVSSPIGGPQIFGAGTSGQTIVTLLSTREILSESVRVKDGQTLVLGGLFTETEQASLAKIPYLSETPVFGALFRNTLKGRARTELLLLITPKVVEEEPSSLTETTPPPMM